MSKNRTGRIAAIIACAAIVMGVGALPASAIVRDGGSFDCYNWGTAAVKGEQSRLNVMTLSLDGKVRYSGSAYHKREARIPSMGYHTWEAKSDSLIKGSGTKGFCLSF